MYSSKKFTQRSVGYRIKMDSVKLHPILSLFVPEDNSMQDKNQVYRLRKIEDIEQYLQKEIKERKAGPRNASKRLGVKAYTHKKIRLLAESKLNSVIDLISKANENVSLVIQEKQRSMMLKEQMRP